MTEPNVYFEKLKKKIININKAFDLLSDSINDVGALLSEEGRFEREVWDELDCCLMPNDGDEPVDIESFKDSLIRSIDWIESANYYDHTIKDFNFKVTHQLRRILRKLGTNYDEIKEQFHD